GRYAFDRDKTLVKVFIFKAPNLMSRFAHDLELHNDLIDGSVEITDDGTTVEATVDLWNLRVIEQLLNPKDRAEAERLMRTKILKRRNVAKARFKGRLAAEGDRPVAQGELSLVGNRRRTVALPFELVSVEDGRFRASLRHELMQSDYGIKPFTAMMGLLKLQDRIAVEIETELKRL
ncbi:MAG: YceI family protein, partial [Deltaproteobacteria bacterium]|nr:YceI family protein [Deltaproteobacteria bacterium]